MNNLLLATIASSRRRIAASPASYLSKASAVGQTGNATLSLPSGVSDGDILIAFFTCRDKAVTTLSGWTLLKHHDVSTGDYSAIYYKVAASEPSSYTFVMTSTGIPVWAGTIIAIRSGKTDGLLFAYTTLSKVAPSLSPACSGIFIGLWGDYYGSMYSGVPAGMTLIETNNTGFGGCGFQTAWQLVDSGATGTRTATGQSDARNTANSIFIPNT